MALVEDGTLLGPKRFDMRNSGSDSFIEVVQDAVDKTGMTEIPELHMRSEDGRGRVAC